MFLYDREGVVTPLPLARAWYQIPRASRDGTWLALETHDGKQTAISVYELAGTDSIRRLTHEGNNRVPVWSADGKRVAFQSDREGDRAIFWQPIEGGAATRLTRPEPGTFHTPESWSSSADVMLFSVTKDVETTLWTFSLRDRKATRFGDVTSIGVPTDAVFSPDGRWVAYQTGDAGTAEPMTYVQPFPATGTKFEIVRAGRPMWSPGGRPSCLSCRHPVSSSRFPCERSRRSASSLQSRCSAGSVSLRRTTRGRMTSCRTADSLPSTLQARPANRQRRRSRWS